MVTIADVAKHAGVSSSTVSYVLSGKRAISEQTRLRVESSVRELGYHPNAGARALAGRGAKVTVADLDAEAGANLFHGTLTAALSDLVAWAAETTAASFTVQPPHSRTPPGPSWNSFRPPLTPTLRSSASRASARCCGRGASGPST